MTINLIAKNKIADYIEQHPEAQTTFLAWLKDFPYMEGPSIARRIKRSSPGELSPASSPLNNGEYQIEYHTNYWLKTTYITWLGSRDEREAFSRAEFEKARAKNPGLEFRTKVTTIKLVPPPPPSQMSSGSILISLDGNSTIVETNEETRAPAEQLYIESDQDFKTKAEYEKALNRAIAIFDARPETPEFDELNLLLPLIKHYEDSKLVLPQLDMADVIRHEIKSFDMLKPLLNPVIGNEDDVNLFLAGKKQLSEETLKAACGVIGIRF
ncbi:MAG: hypothetical protein JWR38_2515 [Mucilaginibacter sp.]|nr:hypothetical protein [Mucilaginibacter sp.]